MTSQNKIRNKAEFYELYSKGLLGNRALTWNSQEELMQSSWRGDVCIRGTGIPRIHVKYNIPFEEVDKTIKDLTNLGYPKSILRFNQSMPDENLIIQGEVMDYFLNGLELTYSNVKKPMNRALKQEMKYANGLTAKLMLQSAMDPSSYSDLQALFETYDGAVVEFSTYSVNVGDIPNRNTVFWEVRNY